MPEKCIICNRPLKTVESQDRGMGSKCAKELLCDPFSHVISSLEERRLFTNIKTQENLDSEKRENIRHHREAVARLHQQETRELRLPNIKPSLITDQDRLAIRDWFASINAPESSRGIHYNCPGILLGPNGIRVVGIRGIWDTVNGYFAIYSLDDRERIINARAGQAAEGWKLTFDVMLAATDGHLDRSVFERYIQNWISDHKCKPVFSGIVDIIERETTVDIMYARRFRKSDCPFPMVFRLKISR